jgi:hypothetical protein
MVTRGSFPGGKAGGAWADHSPPSSVEVKEWTELYLHCPNTWCSVKSTGLTLPPPLAVIVVVRLQLFRCCSQQQILGKCKRC